MAALLGGKSLAPAPPSFDWTKGMQADLGVMLNDQLSDCTCAAFFHAIQVWGFNSGLGMFTEPDANVLQLYEAACGYDPSNPSTDGGGVEQDVLTYLLKHGAATGEHGSVTNKIAAFIEVDPRNIEDVKRTIYDCGIAYIGMDVPAYLPEDPGSVWDIDLHANQKIEGGHAVILAGYDPHGVRVISWGSYYTMTWAFFARFVDECYAVADRTFLKANGKTPIGMTLEGLEEQMSALRAA